MQFDRDQKVPDTQSDPAHTPGDGWVEEGGASHLGPATHIESGHEAAAEEERRRVAREDPAEVVQAERGSAS